MNELEIQELLEKLIPAVKEGVMGDVNKALNGLSAKLQKPKRDEDSPVSEVKDASVLALQTELQALKASLETEKNQSLALSRKAALQPYLTKTIKPDVAAKLIDEEIAAKASKGEDGKWYVSDGDATVGIDTYVAGYLDSDKGSWLKAGLSAKSTEVKGKDTFKQPKSSETDSNQQFASILEQAGLI